MSIESELNAISTGLDAIYDKIEAKGGTLPVNKNLNNLASSIASIPLGSAVFGKIRYYPFSTQYTSSGPIRCTVNSINQEQLTNFLGGEESNVVARYTSASGVWTINAVSIAPEDMLSTTGIDVTINDGVTNARFAIRYETTIDTSADPIVVDLTSSEYNSLGSSENYYTLGGKNIIKDAITSFEFGNTPTTTPTNFLIGCRGVNGQGMTLIGLENSSLTSLGEGFLSTSSKVSNALTFPSTLVEIGDKFMYEGQSNVALTFPNSLTTIGDLFIGTNPQFNQPIDLSNTSLTNIGDSFLTNCTTYNQPISLPNTPVAIGDNFMFLNASFRQTFILPNTVSSVGRSFFCYHSVDAAFKLVLNAPASVAMNDIPGTYTNRTLQCPDVPNGNQRVRITLSGAYASEWKAKFPDFSVSYQSGPIQYRWTQVEQE